ASTLPQTPRESSPGNTSTTPNPADRSTPGALKADSTTVTSARSSVTIRAMSPTATPGSSSQTMYSTGTGTLTPLGTYTNSPPVCKAPLKAATLLSRPCPPRTSSRGSTNSECSRTAVARSVTITPAGNPSGSWRYTAVPLASTTSARPAGSPTCSRRDAGSSDQLLTAVPPL